MCHVSPSLRQQPRSRPPPSRPRSPTTTRGMSARTNIGLSPLRLLVPPLAATSYKGSSGKVGVVGGCFEYTGAPFYAALSALKLGADLSHVFCDEQAAAPIKGYSPELIVHGCLRSGVSDAAARERQADEVTKWFPALSALVVGPGLGRDAALQAVAALVVERAIEASLPCVLDADGLRLVVERPALVRGAKWVVRPTAAARWPGYAALVLMVRAPRPMHVPPGSHSEQARVRPAGRRPHAGQRRPRQGSRSFVGRGRCKALCRDGALAWRADDRAQGVRRRPRRAHGLRSAIAASSRPRMDVAIAQADRLGERWEW